MAGKTHNAGNVTSIIRLICDRICSKDAPGKILYCSNKQIILNLFKNTSTEYSLDKIVLRLSVIDSMYSTNMNRRYFGIQELAQAIFELGSEEEAAKDFDNFLKDDSNHNSKITQLFECKYGIHKNLEKAGTAVSLISKYAYYHLMLFKDKYPYGFPIYDSLALKVMPLTYKYITGKEMALESKKDIRSFLSNISSLLSELDNLDDFTQYGMQKYDMLDAYLWTIGKILKENLSLIMSKECYIYQHGSETKKASESIRDELKFFKEIEQHAKELSL